jgi:tetratricopeptide (TPR) repeat protein
MQQSLEIKKQVLGTNHPDYALSLHNLAVLYFRQKQFKKAIPLSKRALHIFMKTLPSTHPNIKLVSDSLIEALIMADQLQPNRVKAYRPKLMAEIRQMNPNDF